MDALSRSGRACLGAAVTASGLMQVINADLVRLVPKFPAWLPGHHPVAVALGVGLVLIGGAVLAGWRIRVAALSLAGLLLGSFILQRIPEIASNPGAGFIWTNPVKVLALLGGALLLAGGTGKGTTLAAGLLGVFLLLCGAQHFFYAGFVDSLVPAWIPPGPRFWTYFSGVALVAGGAGVVWPPTRWLAGILSGGMIFLWMLLLHLPRSLEIKSAFELGGVFEALALAGVGWLVAGTAASRSREQVTSPG